MNEQVLNKILPQTKNNLVQIVNELMINESIEGLILGGTELPVILKQSDFDNIEVYDTTKNSCRQYCFKND